MLDKSLKIDDSETFTQDQSSPFVIELLELFLLLLTVLYEVNFPNTASTSSHIPLEEYDRRECVACGEQNLPTELVAANCRHNYCRVCINELFEHALNGPPHCCEAPIALTLAEPFLRADVIDRFVQRDVERNSRNVTYCHVSHCREPIPSSNIIGDRATCPSCGETTCSICQSGTHDGDCPEDPVLRPLMETAAREGWRRCPGCRAMIARSGGCAHMKHVTHLFQILR